MPSWLLNRAPFLLLAACTIALGLLVHHGVIPLPLPVRDVSADALWAMMIAWWVAAIAPTARLDVRSLLALTICWVVEIGQLYHIPTVDRWRETTVGQLVLGSAFDARDLAAYAGGILGAVILERMARRAGLLRSHASGIARPDPVG